MGRADRSGGAKADTHGAGPSLQGLQNVPSTAGQSISTASAGEEPLGWRYIVPTSAHPQVPTGSTIT